MILDYAAKLDRPQPIETNRLFDSELSCFKSDEIGCHQTLMVHTYLGPS